MSGYSLETGTVVTVWYIDDNPPSHGIIKSDNMVGILLNDDDHDVMCFIPWTAIKMIEPNLNDDE